MIKPHQGKIGTDQKPIRLGDVNLALPADKPGSLRDTGHLVQPIHRLWRRVVQVIFARARAGESAPEKCGTILPDQSLG